MLAHQQKQSIVDKRIKDRSRRVKNLQNHLLGEAKHIRQTIDEEKERCRLSKRKEEADTKFKKVEKHRLFLKRRDLYLAQKNRDYVKHRQNALARIKKRKLDELRAAEMESTNRIKAAYIARRETIIKRLEEDRKRLGFI